MRDWVSKNKYFFSPQSSPREPDPDLLWEERRKHQAGGRGPLEGNPRGEKGELSQGEAQRPAREIRGGERAAGEAQEAEKVH